MRKILFRGKTKVIAGSEYNMGKPDGEWVRGYLYNDVGCWKIRQFETSYADYIGYEVDPETVGQYTGLFDRNGKKIFEGDIVAGALHWQERRKNGIVAFRNGSFGLLWYRGEIEQFNPFTSMCNVEYEVIGNVQENPELLKGGAE